MPTCSSSVYGDEMKPSAWSMSQVFGAKSWGPGQYRRFVLDMSVVLACFIVAGGMINFMSGNSPGRAVANLFVGFGITIPLVLLFFSQRSRSRQRRQLADGVVEPTSKSWLVGPSSRPGMIQIGPDRFIKKGYLTAFFSAWVLAPLALAMLWALLMGYSPMGYLASIGITMMLVWLSLLIAVLILQRVKRGHETRA